MKDYTRRSVAFVVGNYSSANKSNVYDYQVCKYFNFSGSDSIYDYAEKCYISYTKNGDKLQLYHYKNKKYIDLSIEKDSFEGYDYDTCKHYSGTVSEDQISIYDYECGKYFNYIIS